MSVLDFWAPKLCACQISWRSVKPLNRKSGTNKQALTVTFMLLVWIQVTVKAINLKTLLTSYIKSLFDGANKNSFIYSSREQKDWAVKLKMVSITKNLFRPRSQHIVTTEVLLFRMPFLRFYCITHPRSTKKIGDFLHWK